MTTATLATPRRDDFGGHAVYLDWERQFLPWMGGRLLRADAAGAQVRLPAPWKPGKHWALIGPTGQGKSTFAVGILGQRKYVVALDPKGEDDTLEAAGYVRITKFPLPRDRFAGARQEPKPGTEDWVWHRAERGLPIGLVVGFRSYSEQQDAQLAQLMRDAITWVRRVGGFGLYVDEFELLSSQRMMRLGADIERMLITARRAGTSVLTSYQAPAWVSKHATRQAGYITVWPTRDVDMVTNVARAAGRPWKVVAAAVDELPRWHCLTIPEEIDRPMIVTTAPKVG